MIHKKNKNRMKNQRILGKYQSIDFQHYDILNSQTNNSVSKQLYSFCKDQRFKQQRTSCDKMYELPDVKTKHSTTLGVGERFPYSIGISPCPSSYSIKSLFQKTPKGKAFTFGISREKYAKVYVKEHQIRGRDAPGPGNYILKDDFGKNAIKWTFSKKMPEKVDLSLSPGKYSVPSSMATTGRNSISKFSNTGFTKINPKNSPPRFKINSWEVLPAGPGSYNPKDSITNDKFINKFKSSGTRFFPKAERTMHESISTTPGYKYNIPSEFGSYTIRPKMQNSGIRIKKRIIAGQKEAKSMQL